MPPQLVPKQKPTSSRPKSVNKPTVGEHEASDALSSVDSPESVAPTRILQLQRTIGNRATSQLLAQRQSTSERGKALPQTLKGTMGKLFGASMDGVQVHTDAQADAIARANDSQATAIGDNIFFQQGAYRPGSADGNALIAREVAHIQRAKQQGDDATSEADKRDAQGVSDLFLSMGAQPEMALAPITQGGKANPVQRQVFQSSVVQRQMIQRDPEFSGGRTAGIVTSKVLQGLFTTVLGPVSLAWRWPLIQKNFGEITGKKVGTREGKGDDRHRYGEGKLGTAMRWMAGISEVLKEFTIWLGFASFIAAIVAAATQGVAAPVFAGIAIATAVVAGLHAVLRGVLVALNGYRLRNEDDPKKRALIKHQMVSDGIDGIGAAISSVLSGLSGGGLGSFGGDIAKMSGITGNVEKLAGTGIGMTTLGVSNSISLNTLKEGGKDVVKPGSEEGFGGGFTKDKKEIDTAYKTVGQKIKGFFTKKKKNNNDDNLESDDNSGGTGGLSTQGTQTLNMTEEIVTKSQENTISQNEDTSESQDDLNLMNTVGNQVIQVTDNVGTAKDSMNESQQKVSGLNDNLGSLVEKNIGEDEGKLKQVTQDVNQGLKESNEETIDPEKPQETNNTSGTNQDLDLKRDTNTIQREGFGSRLKAWFMRGVSKVKAGIKRLNNKVLAGIIKFASKFNKSEEDRKVVGEAMIEQQGFMTEKVKLEQENSEDFGKYQGMASQLQEGVQQLAEKERSGG